MINHKMIKSFFGTYKNTFEFFIIISLLIFSILNISGCENRNSSNEEKINISIWMDNNDKEMAFFKKISRMYEENDTEVKINNKFITFVDLKPVFTGQSKDQNEPDIFFLVNDWIGELAEKGLITEFKGDYSKFIPLTLESMKFNGKLFALPRNFEVITMLYNKKIIPKPPSDTSEMINISLNLKNKGIFGLMYDYTNFYYHAPWLFGFGSEIYDSKGKLAFSGLRKPDSYQFVLDLVNYGILPKKSNQSAMINMFASGKVGMIITGPWEIGTIDKSNIDYGLTTLPMLHNKKALKPFIGVKGFAVTSFSKNPEKAKKIIEFFTNEEIQKIAMSDLGILPSVDAIYQKEKLPDKIKGFYEQAKTGTLLPTHPEMQYIWQEYNWALSQIFYKKASIQKTLDKAAKELEKQVKTENKL